MLPSGFCKSEPDSSGCLLGQLGQVLRELWHVSQYRSAGNSLTGAGSAGHAKQAEHQQHSRHLDEERGSGSSQGDAAGGQTLNDAQPEILDDQASLSSVGTEPLEEGLSQDAANIRKGEPGHYEQHAHHPVANTILSQYCSQSAGASPCWPRCLDSA